MLQSDALGNIQQTFPAGSSLELLSNGLCSAYLRAKPSCLQMFLCRLSLLHVLLVLDTEHADMSLQVLPGSFHAGLLGLQPPTQDLHSMSDQPLNLSLSGTK